MKNYVIKQATTKDVEGIQYVLSTTWEATYCNLKPETISQVKAKWHSTEFLSKQIQNPKFYFICASIGEKIVGIATSAENEPGIIDLFRLYVLPEYQGQGIGSKLVDTVVVHYSAAHKMRIYVEENNEKSISFYEKQGFQKVKKNSETSFGEVIVEWLMEKPLQAFVNFRVGQKVVVFNSDRQILFLKRSPKSSRPGGWDFPGGGLENEEPIEGVKREAREEANIEISNIKPTVLVTHDREEPNMRALIIGYVGRLESGEVKLSFEHDEFKWLSIEEALKVDLPEGHKKFLDAAIAHSE